MCGRVNSVPHQHQRLAGICAWEVWEVYVYKKVGERAPGAWKGEKAWRLRRGFAEECETALPLFLLATEACRPTRAHTNGRDGEGMTEKRPK